MKRLILGLLLTMNCFAAPELDCEVREFPQFPGQLVIIVEGNKEVKELKLITPIDRDSYRTYFQLEKQKAIFVWPNGLPLYPSLFFLVNGKELHFIPQLKQEDFLTRSKDPV